MKIGRSREKGNSCGDRIRFRCKEISDGEDEEEIFVLAGSSSLVLLRFSSQRPLIMIPFPNHHHFYNFFKTETLNRSKPGFIFRFVGPQRNWASNVCNGLKKYNSRHILQ